MIPTETLDAIYTALTGVSDALSKVPDSDADWNQVSAIQAYVSESQEIITSMLDEREDR